MTRFIGPRRLTPKAFSLRVFLGLPLSWLEVVWASFLAHPVPTLRRNPPVANQRFRAELLPYLIRGAENSSCPFWSFLLCQAFSSLPLPRRERALGEGEES